MSCVTSIVVVLFLKRVALIQSCIELLVKESRLAKGSSNNNKSGLKARALPIETLCCWPPDNSCGKLFSLPFKPVTSIIFSIIFLILLGGFLFFFVGKAKPADEINWGIVFSQKHAEFLGLDWKENYSAILDDLGVKHLNLLLTGI